MYALMQRGDFERASAKLDDLILGESVLCVCGQEMRLVAEPAPYRVEHRSDPCWRCEAWARFQHDTAHMMLGDALTPGVEGSWALASTQRAIMQAADGSLYTAPLHHRCAPLIGVVTKWIE